MILRPSPQSSLRPGKKILELLVGVAVLLVIIAIVMTVMRSSKAKGYQVKALAKMQAIGEAFGGYTDDTNGLLPFEDAPGKDDWSTAADESAANVWYNVLPKRMGADSVGELSGEGFYSTSYPLYMPGAPYPKESKRMKKPYFAFGMSSRLQRKGDSEVKEQGNVSAIENTGKTVAFLERGLPDDQKFWAGQKGFDGSPKANPANFAARHNQKGILLFVDGHTELKSPSEVINKAGLAPNPQEDIFWTADPEDNPN